MADKDDEQYWEDMATIAMLDSVIKERDELLIELAEWKARALIAEEEIKTMRADNGQFGVGA